MPIITNILAVLLLVISLLIHVLALWGGGLLKSSKHIYSFQGTNKELDVSSIYKFFTYLIYITYLSGIVLSWGTVTPFVHYFFLSIALIRFLKSISEAKRLSQEDNCKQTSATKELDKAANIAGIVHILYTLIGIF